MIYIKCLIVFLTISVFDINRKETVADEFKIHDQPPCATIAINKWMNRFERQMELSGSRDQMLLIFPYVVKCYWLFPCSFS